ncbi:LPXTG cell wall anchor domain-containing protein, partial [Bacillus cereus]
SDSDSDAESDSNNSSNNGSNGGTNSNSGNHLPQTGGQNESSMLASLGALLTALGSSLFFFNRRKKNTKNSTN